MAANQPKRREHKNLFNQSLSMISSIDYEDFFPGDILYYQGKPRWRKLSDDGWEDLSPETKNDLH
jgi:hypothetical protein